MTGDPNTCCAPHCRRYAGVVYLGRPLCDRHFELETDAAEAAWIAARLKEREGSEGHEDPALGIDGGEVLILGNDFDVDQ